MIEITAAGIEKYQSILQGMGANGEKALRAALSRGSQTARAEATRQLKKRYVIKAGDIRSSGKVFFKAPGAGGLIGELKAQIKDAILDGIIPNEHDAARAYLLTIAAERGLTPRTPTDN